MHEMALCDSLIELVCEQQRQRGFKQVRRVIVEVGVLGHVEPHALEFAFDVQSSDTPAAGAVLEIHEVGGRAWCVDCSTHVSIQVRGDPCPGCGGFGMIVEQGEELRLTELDH